MFRFSEEKGKVFIKSVFFCTSTTRMTECKQHNINWLTESSGRSSPSKNLPCTIQSFFSLIQQQREIVIN